MKASLGRFDGETVLFIRPDDAIELVKIAHTLGLKFKELEVPMPKRYKGPSSVREKQRCFYCEKDYAVTQVRTKVWRRVCLEKACKREYARDRHLYKTNPVLFNRQQLVRNLNAQGVSAKLDKRK